MRAADCARRFVLLAAGGVRVLWACGAELVNPAETARSTSRCWPTATRRSTNHRRHRHG